MPDIGEARLMRILRRHLRPSRVPISRVPGMSRKSVLLGVAILVVLVGGSSAVLAALLRHERHFYLRLAVPPGPEREREAQAFWGTLGNIGAEIANRDEWT